MPLAACLLGWLGGCLGLAGQDEFPRLRQVEESQLWTSAGNNSRYIAAEAVSGTDDPVVMAGNFSNQVTFPSHGFDSGYVFGTTLLYVPSGNPTIFAGVLSNVMGNWGVRTGAVDFLEPQWPYGYSEAFTNDIAVLDRSESYVVGYYQSATSFRNRGGTTFPLDNPSSTTNLAYRGFVALANNGVFQGAWSTSDSVYPYSVAADPDGDFLVVAGQHREVDSGIFIGLTPDSEIHRHALPLPAPSTLPLAGTVVGPIANTVVRHLDLTTDKHTWAGGNTPGAGALGGIDAWVGRIDFDLNSVPISFLVGSTGNDEVADVARGPHGELYVLLDVDTPGRNVSFGPLSYDLDAIPNPPATGTRHSFVVMIDRDDVPRWMTPLAIVETSNDKMTGKKLSVDAAGNVFATVQCTAGNYRVEGVSRALSGGAQFLVNGRGRVIDGVQAPSVAIPATGAVSDLENRMILGRSLTLSAFSTLEATEVEQTSYFICAQNPGTTSIEDISTLVTGVGGQVHLEFPFASQGTVAVAAWLTPDQFAVLDMNPIVKVVEDPLIVSPDSGPYDSVTSPDWALARLFDPYLVDPTGPDAAYYYPSGFVTEGSPEKIARVYVIDKGLADEEPFEFADLGSGAIPIVFDGPGRLSVDALVYPTDNGDLVPDTSSNHPRQVVNLIAAEQFGAAPGTAIEFINVDVYTGASPDADNCLTYASYVAHAISQALDDAIARNLSLPPGESLPNVIVIASSGQDPGDQVGLGSSLQQALDLNIPVIVSAGNNSGGGVSTGGSTNVADYVPAQHGDKPGVITVGATALPAGTSIIQSLKTLNPLYEFGNRDPSGNIISLYAPGAGMATGFGSSSGTSFSCALVGGLAATYLSKNPTATPAEVEAALVELSAYDPERQIHIARSVCGFAAWLYRQGLGGLADCVELALATDSDLDGDDNLTEYFGQGDPLNPQIRARIPVELAEITPAIELVIELPQELEIDEQSVRDGCWSVPLTIQLSPDLGQWSDLPPAAITATPGLVQNRLRKWTFSIDPAALHADPCFVRFVFGPLSSP